MPLYPIEVCKGDPEEARMMAWYMTGIKHAVLKIAKKQQCLQKHEILIMNNPIYDHEGNSIEMIDTIADVREMVLKVEEKINFEQLLQHLSSKQQQVIKMIFYQEMTEKETGAVTATVLAVEFIKEIRYLKLLPTRWLVFIVAEAIVISTSIAKGEFTVINGLLITTSAMGSWQIINDTIFGNIRGRLERKH